MKKQKISFLLLFGFLNVAFAHKEWVHQYQVRQAYLFLENQIGVVPGIKNAIDFTTLSQYDPTIDENSPWKSDYGIWIGAWREDEEDPIYEYVKLNFNPLSPDETAITPSITHFWLADVGDNEKHEISLNSTSSGASVVTTVIKSNVENAWEKAKLYLFGGHEIFIKKEETVTIFVKDVFSGLMVPAEIDIQGTYFRYSSLVDFFLTGNVERTAVKTAFNLSPFFLSGERFDLSPPSTKPLPIATARRYAYHILGRVAHLLGDMSVPAHTHNHSHPCDLKQPDDYEMYMGGVYCASGGFDKVPKTGTHNNFPVTFFPPCNAECNATQTTFPAQNYTAATATSQGGLICDIFNYGGNDEASIRHLFYTLNQLTAYFPSGTNFSSHLESIRQVYCTSGTLLNSTEICANTPIYPDYNSATYKFGNEVLSNAGSVNLSFLQSRFNSMNANLPSQLSHNISIIPEEIANETFNYSIRAIATLFYWFAVKTNQSVYPKNLVIDNFSIPNTYTYNGPGVVVSGTDYRFQEFIDHFYDTHPISSQTKAWGFDFKARQTITIGPGVLLGGDSHVILNAGQEITAVPGVEAKPGSYVEAKIDPLLDFSSCANAPRLGHFPSDSSRTVGDIVYTYNSPGNNSDNITGASVLEKTLHNNSSELGSSFASPNPSRGMFYVLLPYNAVPSVSTIIIYNTLGEQIYKKEFYGLRYAINLSQHPPGIYFAKIHSGNKENMQKLVIE